GGGPDPPAAGPTPRTPPPRPRPRPPPPPGARTHLRLHRGGDHDQVAVGMNDRTPLTSAEPDGPPAPDKPWPGFLERFAPAYEAELAAFVDVVRGERANPCDGREALHALRIADGGEMSRGVRRAVRIWAIDWGGGRG
ncbi:Gfo/Idh/MocA family oxidoreductase, partial [Streptomyces lasiicapitis]|uniref:Gfo/Idh/MocA family oxidoreductase n=1 Tax=Streptomyces lasiicapitis TaxID=1923961 RepID=UPI0036AFF445